MVGLLWIMTSCKVHDKNSNLEFITKDDFTNIQKNIRTLLLNKDREKEGII